ncbi:MAG: hypothetical protein ABI207_05715 [Crocinitomicaceae bacterium]
MKAIFTLFLLLFLNSTQAQTAKDLFTASDVKITWLGIDFSHVKLIGDFAQFNDAGQKSVVDIKDQYFPAWNKLIVSEPDKYDLKGMLRKENIIYDIDMITNINAKAPVEEMEAQNAPDYTLADIEKFVKKLPIKNKDGIGILMIAESLNKNAVEAYFHFVAINMSTKEILIHERIKSEPSGFGIRNYWAGSIYQVIKKIKATYYKSWKAEFN